MNKERRRRLNGVVCSLSEIDEETGVLETQQVLSDSFDEVECVKDEEQEALDCMPENLQFSQRYEDMEQNVSDLEDASASIEFAMSAFEDDDEAQYSDIESDIEDAINSINEVIER